MRDNDISDQPSKYERYNHNALSLPAWLSVQAMQTGEGPPSLRVKALLAASSGVTIWVTVEHPDASWQGQAAVMKTTKGLVSAMSKDPDEGPFGSCSGRAGGNALPPDALMVDDDTK